MNSHAWYIRKKGSDEIKGPFPAGQISQEVLLGRHQLNDEVSQDKEEWFSLQDIPALVPEIYHSDKDDPAFKQKLDAARRWADERRGISDSNVENDRRSGESYEHSEMMRLHNLAMQAENKPGFIEYLFKFGLLAVFIAAVVFMAFRFSPVDKTEVNCDAEIVPGLNLANCRLNGIKLVRKNMMGIQLQGAELQTANLNSSNLTNANLKYAQLHLASLSYTDFTNANLVGANLRGADLSGATLENADLSYANLSDAIIYNVDFTNTRLSKTIWTDGRVCAENSISSCN